MSNYDAQTEAIIAQSKPVEKTKAPDKKFTKEVLMTKYFNPMVDKTAGKTTSTFYFRILPTLDDTSPFKEIKLHTGLKLGNEWQKFICLKSVGLECPLCDTEEGLRKQGDKEEAKKYRTLDFYVVKGIDRTKESEGVKYWRFKRKYDGTGPFDKISILMTLFKGILNPDTGYDLVITCTLDQSKTNQKSYSIISSINCVTSSPLAKTEEQAQEWLNEDSTWQDVYSIKTPEYLSDVVNGTAKYWDDATKRFVTPAQLAKEQEKAENEASGERGNPSSVESNPLLTGESFDDSGISDDDLPF